MNRSRLLTAGLVAMIVLPAVTMAVFGYRSFDAELRAERAERRDRVRAAFDRVWDALDETLAEVDRRENARSFREYDGDAINRRRIPWIRGYWRLDGERLSVPPGYIGTGTGPRSLKPFPILEDVKRHLSRHPLPADFAGVRSETRSDDAAQVRYGAFVYVADPPDRFVYARRIVRVLETGRTLHHGFVIDVEAFLADAFPALAARAGERNVRVRIVPRPPSAYAYPPNRPLGPMFPGLALLAEETDTDSATQAVAGARDRFVLLIVALMAVIVVGLILLRRTVGAELVLARRRADFVAAVSHELRTPLTGIRMYADMLRDGWVKDPDTIREYHESMARESERLSRLVQNVLDFSALEKGRKDFRIERGDLGAPVREALDLLAPYLAEKGFEVEVEIPDDLPEVPRDSDAVQQCVVNLVDNAVKYAKGREPAIVHVALERTDGRIDLTVRDHGPGLPESERERVFDPFFRGKNPAASEVGGAGLGLALVRRFARAHGGAATAEEAPGGGARFRVTFPAG